MQVLLHKCLYQDYAKGPSADKYVLGDDALIS